MATKPKPHKLDRERHGAFYTPKQWVKLSQQYLADNLGSNWQQTHYVWDCAAGTGNLLQGLTNPNNIFASTIDPNDVQTIISRCKPTPQSKDSPLNLKTEHIFQFDFLNDDLLGKKVPPPLQRILADPKEQEKLILYINPPYAEATSLKTTRGTGSHKTGVANSNQTHLKYKDILSRAANELYAQFLIRIHDEIPRATIAHFATLKALLGSNFKGFRAHFQHRLCALCIMPSFTFENVTGAFPIGFYIWDPSTKEPFCGIEANVYDENAQPIGTKSISDPHRPRLNIWAKQHDTAKKGIIGYIENPSPDMQRNSLLYLSNEPGTAHANHFAVAAKTLIPAAVYFSVRLAITPTWINDRDQFFYPELEWSLDSEFHADCLAFILLHAQNRIQIARGMNHWIPYSEEEVNAKSPFQSHFMHDFINGRLEPDELSSTNDTNIVELTDYQPYYKSIHNLYNGTQPVLFSPEARHLLEAGRLLWQHYHAQKNINPNAAFYDIREYFQGRTHYGRMKRSSSDARYMNLLLNLRTATNDLAHKKIAPKAIQYGFLR